MTYKYLEEIAEKNILKNSLRIKYFLFLCNIIEIIQIHVCILDLIKNKNFQISQEINSDSYYTNKSNYSFTLSYYIRYTSLIHFTKKLKICNSFKFYITNKNKQISNSSILICGYSNFLIFSILFAIILYFIFILYNTYKEYKNNLNSNIIDNSDFERVFSKILKNKISNANKKLKIIFYNFHYFIFQIFGNSIYDIFVNGFLDSYKKFTILHQNSNHDPLLLFKLFGLIFYIFLYIWYAKNITVINNYSRLTKNANDNLFGRKYATFCLIIKFLLVIENNLSSWQTIQNKSLQFIRICIYIGPLLFLFYILFEILHKNILYIINMKLNTLRLFNVMQINIFILFNFTFRDSFEKLNYNNIFVYLFALFICFFISLYLNKLNSNNI